MEYNRQIVDYVSSWELYDQKQSDAETGYDVIPENEHDELFCWNLAGTEEEFKKYYYDTPFGQVFRISAFQAAKNHRVEKKNDDDMQD